MDVALNRLAVIGAPAPAEIHRPDPTFLASRQAPAASAYDRTLWLA
jgi:hypothetical protein